MTYPPSVLFHRRSGNRNPHLRLKGDTGVFNITPSNVNVDYDYLSVYGIKLKEGRSFSRDNTLDKGFSFVINESLAKELSLKETALATISYHTIRSARANPVKALRYE